MTGFLVTFADDTERKRRQAQLFDTEQRYRELFENAPDIVYSIDLEGNYTSINRAGEQVLGYNRAELLQMNITELLEPEPDRALETEDSGAPGRGAGATRSSSHSGKKMAALCNSRSAAG